jgi:hypothetical protein
MPARIILAGFFLPAFMAAAGGLETRELLDHPQFEQGFNVMAPKEGKRVPEGVLRSGGDTAAAPIWDMAQWNTRFSIATARPAPLANGGIQFTNAAKRIVISTTGQLTLAVNAGVEYAGRARRKGESWPHLLVSQRFAESPSLAELQEVVLKIAVRLRRTVAHPTPDDTPQLHAAQSLLYVIVQNLNRQSPGYGDFLYLGVPFYDNRWRSSESYAAPDRCGKFIYTPAAEVYTTQDKAHMMANG